jgi:hypothetical protein
MICSDFFLSGGIPVQRTSFRSLSPPFYLALLSLITSDLKEIPLRSFLA